MFCSDDCYYCLDDADAEVLFDSYDSLSYVCVYVYIYIYREREIEREREIIQREIYTYVFV